MFTRLHKAYLCSFEPFRYKYKHFILELREANETSVMRGEYNEWAKQQAESTAVMFLITSLQNTTGNNY